MLLLVLLPWRVLESHLIASVRRKTSAPIDADYIQIKLLAIHMNDNKMVRGGRVLVAGFHQMFEPHFAGFVGFQIVAKIRLTRI